MLDPMAGLGTIPIGILQIKVLIIKTLEGALAHPEAYFLAADNNLPALKGALTNIKNHVTGNNCDAIQWDVRKLPLKNEVVDVIISDLPFGHKHGTCVRNRRTLTHVLDINQTANFIPLC